MLRIEAPPEEVTQATQRDTLQPPLFQDGDRRRAILAGDHLAESGSGPIQMRKDSSAERQARR